MTWLCGGTWPYLTVIKRASLPKVLVRVVISVQWDSHVKQSNTESAAVHQDQYFLLAHHVFPHQFSFLWDSPPSPCLKICSFPLFSWQRLPWRIPHSSRLPLVYPENCDEKPLMLQCFHFPSSVLNLSLLLLGTGLWRNQASKNKTILKALLQSPEKQVDLILSGRAQATSLNIQLTFFKNNIFLAQLLGEM